MRAPRTSYRWLLAETRYAARQVETVEVRPGWRHTRSVYGPLFTALSTGVVWVSGGSVLVGRLLFQAMQAAGPKAKRADVVAALKKIDDFSANGLLAPAGPASKRPPDCELIAQLKGGKWSRYDTPAPGYRCGDGPYLVRQR